MISLDLKDMKSVSKIVLSIFIIGNIFIFSLVLLKYLPPNVLGGWFLFWIAVKLFNATFPKIIRNKNKMICVILTTLYFLIAPIVIGIFVLMSVLFIPNIEPQRLNLIVVYFVYILCTSLVSVFTLIWFKIYVIEKKQILKLSLSLITALFGTAYGLFDILELVDVNEFLKPLFFGTAISLLFSNVIVEW